MQNLKLKIKNFNNYGNKFLNSQFSILNSQFTIGVSIIELLVILSIIVLLVALVIAEYGRMDDKAVRNTAIHSVRTLLDAVKMYKIEEGKYPETIEGQVKIKECLANYTDVTKIINTFNKDIATPLEGIRINKLSATCACIDGVIAKIENNYWITYCTGSGCDENNNRRKFENQPTCCWQKYIDCSVDANFYKCEEKL